MMALRSLVLALLGVAACEAFAPPLAPRASTRSSTCITAHRVGGTVIEDNTAWTSNKKDLEKLWSLASASRAPVDTTATPASDSSSHQHSQHVSSRWHISEEQEERRSHQWRQSTYLPEEEDESVYSYI
ncbi:hypothetical protein JKP88DRAFT_232064 [Tribonema minus]|uniref:Uncharacterized protein n=1 Tax=Tribonema minus TaxID=303371 RepID=A0A835ZCP6_9STRA|nr:hypothetical protein JKP88DRAFT_232064 [Tribonema minus]